MFTMKDYTVVLFGACILIALLLIFFQNLIANNGVFNDNNNVKKIRLDHPASDCWPLTHTWLWEIKMTKEKDNYTVKIRGFKEDLPPGKNAFLPNSDALPEGASICEFSSGSFGTVGNESDAKVNCQLINLNEIGIPVENGEPLRLLVFFSTAGGRTQISGEKTKLKGEQLIATHVIPKPEWKNDKCNLLAILTQSQNVLYKYYVFIQRRES